MYVHRSVEGRFVDKLAARVAALRVGPATDAQSQIGPMINERAVEKIARHVQDAVAHGARVVTGGRRLDGAEAPGAGHYYAPTVLVGATPAMALAHEETFGPVVPVFAFDSEEEALSLIHI